MRDDRTGQTAVIFASRRTGADAAGYAEAAAAMDALAARQPGFCGMDSVSDGVFGITVSYWADEAAAIAWRHHPDHAGVREQGRGVWYDSYTLSVATVTRAYDWARA